MVRMTWYVVDRVEYVDRLKELGTVYREVMGKNFPGHDPALKWPHWLKSGQRSRSK
jgi:hypothetical protein